MKSVYNSNPANLYCFLNPAICQNHFEVDYDIYQLFRKKYIDKSYYFKKGEKWYIDLKKIIHNELQNIGVLKENIYDCDICSYENTFIHSYRRDKEGFKLSVSYITIKGVK
jgi:copper oxidase (laccase) domain-containing protein